eukprot:CAMPEP_0115307558 /NCGR_PEP_ID=MMETSP0270-20121206/73207_1 /TAXON_ID=71861 /ORGANISM="Scrippsiella trochoidea, Strain CCMP3099" /LENGTH=30 /DNA_ID= /DNA_START= /DNA_END= /DNA_ORIENTATION=
MTDKVIRAADSTSDLPRLAMAPIKALNDKS